MNLIKTSFFNGIAVAVRMLSYFLLNKILAVLLGPSGYVAIGQFQNAIQMITTFSSGAISTGVTKYTAENSDNSDGQIKIWQSAGKVTFLGSLIVGLLVAILCKPLSVFFFKQDSYYYVFICLAVSLLFFNFNVLLQAILTGKKEIKLYIFSNIVGSILSLAVISLMAYYWKVGGALIALVIYQSIAFFVTAFLCLRKHWFRFTYLYGQLDFKILRNFGKYTLMAMVSATMVPLTQMFLRDLVIKRFSVDVGGLWEAMNRVSSAYLLLLTTTLNLYLLPRLSEIKSNLELKEELKSTYKIIAPFVILLSVSIYFLRFEVIKILFTADFIEMHRMFMWQLAGDTMKILSWIMGYVLLARAYYRAVIISEVCFSILLYGLSYAFLMNQKLEFIALGYFVNHFLHFTFMFLLLKKKEIF